MNILNKLKTLWKDDRGEVGVKDETTPTESETPEKTEETTETGEKKETKVSEPDAKTKRALEFYEALTGPNGMKVLEQVAKQFDMRLTTEKDVEKVVNKAASIFQQELGEDYEFLAPKLEKAVDRYIKEKVEPQIEAAKVSSAENRYNQAIDNFYRRNGIPKEERAEVYKELDKASKRLGLVDGESLDDYLDDLYTLVSTKNTGLKEKIERATKIRRNLDEEEVPPYGSGEFSIKPGPKNPTIEEAVEAAARGIKWED